MEDQKIAAIILAAGDSSRLGFPKQLVPFDGKTLLEHSILVALGSKCDPIIVVLGANFELIRTKIKDYPIIILENQEWEEGIGGSIRCGINYLEKNKDMEAVILMLCDQPYVSATLLNDLKAKYRVSLSWAVASCYQDVKGVPALFDKNLFEELKALKGDEGARKLIARHQDKIESVFFLNGYIDIDSEKDLTCIDYKKHKD